MRLGHQKDTLAKIIHELAEKEPEIHLKRQKGKTFIVLPFLLLINGCSVGYLSGNYYLIPVLGIGFFSLAFAIKRKTACVSLKPALTVITKAYIANRDIKQAIENCLPALPETYQPYFSRFLELPISDGIAYLKTQIKFSYFYKWCDMLWLCQAEFLLYPLLLEVIQTQLERDIAVTFFLEDVRSIRNIFLLCSVLLFGAFVISIFIIENCRSFFLSEQGKLFTAVYMSIFFISSFCILVARKESEQCTK